MPATATKPHVQYHRSNTDGVAYEVMADERLVGRLYRTPYRLRDYRWAYQTLGGAASASGFPTRAKATQALLQAVAP